MATTMVHIRVDENLKREPTAALESMGLSLSDAVRLLLVRVAAEKALPFEVRVPNARTLQAVHEIEAGNLDSFESLASLMGNGNEKD